MLARLESESGNRNDPPFNYGGYQIILSWNIGRITGAFIETYNVYHFLSFAVNKATLIRIDFNNSLITFQRPLPSTLSSLTSLISTVFISDALFYSLGQETSFTNTSTISYNLGSSKIHSLVYKGKDNSNSCYNPVLNLLDVERMTN